MRLYKYLKDKLVFIVFRIILIIVFFNFLILFDISNFGIFLFLFSFLIINFFELIVDFYKKNKFYKILYKSLDGLEKKFYISEIIKNSNFVEGEILIDILSQTSKSMNDEIGIYKRLNFEYEDYIETWVHEIKMPISVVNLMVYNNDFDKKELTNQIEKINDYVEQALYYAKSVNVEDDYIVKKINLERFIKKIIRNKSSYFIKNKITFEFENLNYNVFSDQKWLEFIINQILFNSIKYRKDNLTIIFNAICNENNIIFSIKDNGVGINSKDLKKVFKKGYTGLNGRKFSKSTGIGLYLCQKLCKKMNLDISINSKENVYTEVLITFPKEKII